MRLKSLKLPQEQHFRDKEPVAHVELYEAQ